jgi:hypothetical protein
MRAGPSARSQTSYISSCSLYLLTGTPPTSTFAASEMSSTDPQLRCALPVGEDAHLGLLEREARVHVHVVSLRSHPLGDLAEYSRSLSMSGRAGSGPP